MSHTTFDVFHTTVPRFYAAGAHAPQVPDRSLREVHADVSVMVALAVEAIRARSLGRDVRAAWLLGHAEAGLTIELCGDPQLYYAELTALRQVLTGHEVDEGLAEYSWSSTAPDYRARAGVRADAVHAQLRRRHPLLLEWPLNHQVFAEDSAVRAQAVVEAREHLLSYGIDPTEQVVLDELTAYRRGGGVAERRLQGYGLYGGVLLGQTGLYLRPDTTTPLAELLDATTPLLPAEADLLARARALDPAAQAPVWVAALVALLGTWIARVPAGL